MLAGLAGGIGGASGGASVSMPSSATSALSDRSPINIAPVGFNLGAILQPMTQGGPENGGAGIDFLSRYSGVGVGQLSAGSVGATNYLPFILIGGAALVALFFFMR